MEIFIHLLILQSKAFHAAQCTYTVSDERFEFFFVFFYCAFTYLIPQQYLECYRTKKSPNMDERESTCWLF